jgi:hypothetical protein
MLSSWSTYDFKGGMLVDPGHQSVKVTKGANGAGFTTEEVRHHHLVVTTLGKNVSELLGVVTMRRKSMMSRWLLWQGWGTPDPL